MKSTCSSLLILLFLATAESTIKLESRNRVTKKKLRESPAVHNNISIIGVIVPDQADQTQAGALGLSGRHILNSSSQNDGTSTRISNETTSGSQSDRVSNYQRARDMAIHLGGMPMITRFDDDTSNDSTNESTVSSQEPWHHSLLRNREKSRISRNNKSKDSSTVSNTTPNDDSVILPAPSRSWTTTHEPWQSPKSATRTDSQQSENNINDLPRSESVTKPLTFEHEAEKSSGPWAHHADDEIPPSQKEMTAGDEYNWQLQQENYRSFENKQAALQSILNLGDMEVLNLFQIFRNVFSAQMTSNTVANGVGRIGLPDVPNGLLLSEWAKSSLLTHVMPILLRLLSLVPYSEFINIILATHLDLQPTTNDRGKNQDDSTVNFDSQTNELWDLMLKTPNISSTDPSDGENVSSNFESQANSLWSYEQPEGVTKDPTVGRITNDSDEISDADETKNGNVEHDLDSNVQNLDNNSDNYFFENYDITEEHTTHDISQLTHNAETYDLMIDGQSIAFEEKQIENEQNLSDESRDSETGSNDLGGNGEWGAPLIPIPNGNIDTDREKFPQDYNPRLMPDSIVTSEPVQIIETHNDAPWSDNDETTKLMWEHALGNDSNHNQRISQSIPSIVTHPSSTSKQLDGSVLDADFEPLIADTEPFSPYGEVTDNSPNHTDDARHIFVTTKYAETPNTVYKMEMDIDHIGSDYRDNGDSQNPISYEKSSTWSAADVLDSNHLNLPLGPDVFSANSEPVIESAPLNIQIFDSNEDGSIKKINLNRSKINRPLKSYKDHFPANSNWDVVVSGNPYEMTANAPTIPLAENALEYADTDISMLKGDDSLKNLEQCDHDSTSKFQNLMSTEILADADDFDKSGGNIDALEITTIASDDQFPAQNIEHPPGKLVIA